MTEKYGSPFVFVRWWSGPFPPGPPVVAPSLLDTNPCKHSNREQTFERSGLKIIKDNKLLGPPVWKSHCPPHRPAPDSKAPNIIDLRKVTRDSAFDAKLDAPLSSTTDHSRKRGRPRDFDPQGPAQPGIKSDYEESNPKRRKITETATESEEKGQEREALLRTQLLAPKASSDTSGAKSETNRPRVVVDEAKPSTTDPVKRAASPGGASPSVDRAATPLPRMQSFLGTTFVGCRSVEEFDKICKIGDGTYGVVYKAKDRQTQEVVALKKVKMDKEKEGFPITSLREIRSLMQCKHTNIVNVKEILTGTDDSIYIAMEYLEHDLRTLMEDKGAPFSISEIKCLMLQLLQAVEYLHENWTVHRDIKTSNLLLNNTGYLKLCDLGLAREYSSPLRPMTQLVVTLWYRAPELLLGATVYGPAVDMWAVGCVFAELLQNDPLFKGQGELDQLDQIFKMLGTANDRIWPGFSSLPHAQKLLFTNQPYNRLRSHFSAISDKGFELLNKMLTYNPDRRIKASEALKHPWFEESPLPKEPEMMPTWPSRTDGRPKRTHRPGSREEAEQLMAHHGEVFDFGGEEVH